MSDLTEREIFDCLITHFREAEVLCLEMEKTPLRGRQYKRMIEVCKLIEGACRQAAHWRENYAWLDLGNDVHKLQVMMGGWIRSQVSYADKRTARAKAMWRKASETMARLKKLAEVTKNRRTGRIGAILPVAVVDTSRQRMVQVPRMTPGGIYLPDSVSVR